MDTLWQDLKYGLRQLGRNPGFTAVAVLTLALGIGATTIIFSVVNAVLLRQPPYQEPNRLAVVWEKRVSEGVYNNPASPLDFFDWRQRNQVFSGMAAHLYSTMDLTGQGEPERLATGIVSASFFDVLGVRPALGRAFLPEEEQAGKNRVVILSHGLWQRRFGSDPRIVGRPLTLDGEPHEIVGVLPASFLFPAPEELWRPLVGTTSEMQTRTMHSLLVLARMKPDVTLDQAGADMDRVGGQLSREYPESNAKHGAHVVSLREVLVGDVRSALLMLLGAVGFVLLIVCANVANLQLARATGRRKEMGIRAALGASPRHILQHVLVESVLLSTLGGTLGLLFAIWGNDALPLLLPPGTVGTGSGTPLDARVLGFTLVVSLATGVLFGMAPAWHAARPDLVGALKEGSRSTTAGRLRQRFRSSLVVAQVSLALVLLVGAGLLMRSFVALLDVNPGFDPRHLLTVLVALPSTSYPEPVQTKNFFQDLLQKVETLPGVEAAGAISLLPLGGNDARRGIEVEGREPAPDEPTRAHIRVVTPGYFSAMRIPLLAGRLPSWQDAEGAALVVLVNKTMAERYWPGQSPVGRRLRLAGSAEWREVVGVVGDVKHWGLGRGVNPEMYFPLRQASWPAMNLILRSGNQPENLAGAVRAKVRELDANLPLSEVQTMDDVMAGSVAQPRFYMILLAIFAGLALALSIGGIYGVMAYTVRQRTQEIGVRIALGAQARDILGMVAWQGLSLALLGLAIGIVAAFALTRLLKNLLFEVKPADPLTFAAVAVLLLAAALLACYLPARRATRVDPMVALRFE